MLITRRAFITGTSVSTLAMLANRARGQQPDPYQTLLMGQYANDLQLLQQEGGLYMGDNFQLSSTPMTWTLRLGRYPGRYNDHNVDLHGYWIYKKNVNQCWQAVNYGGGPLAFWNADGRARGNPEDWELFTFEKVDQNSDAQHTVRISNSAYTTHMTWMTGHVPNTSPCYVNLVGNTFQCSDIQQNGAVFIVAFPTSPNFRR